MLWRSTVLLKQLLGGVVLCGFLQSVDCRIALLVQLANVGVGVGDAVVEVARERIANEVDAAKGQYRLDMSTCEPTPQGCLRAQTPLRYPSCGGQ